MVRYPFSYRSKEAEIIWAQVQHISRRLPKVAEARNSDGSMAIRVFQGPTTGTYVVYAPGWKVNRHDKTRLRAEADKRYEEAVLRDEESRQADKPEIAVKSLRRLAQVTGSDLYPVSYPRRLCGESLETYLFILDGKMNDGVHDSSHWEEFFLECKDTRGITLGELYGTITTKYEGIKIVVPLTERRVYEVCHK